MKIKRYIFKVIIFIFLASKGISLFFFSKFFIESHISHFCQRYVHFIKYTAVLLMAWFLLTFYFSLLNYWCCFFTLIKSLTKPLLLFKIYLSWVQSTQHRVHFTWAKGYTCWLFRGFSNSKSACYCSTLRLGDNWYFMHLLYSQNRLHCISVIHLLFLLYWFLWDSLVEKES